VVSLNKVMIIGCVGRAPEMRYTPDGEAVTSFAVVTAPSEERSQDGHHVEAEWFNVVARGPLAETCKSQLHNGDQVYVEGRLQSRCWETRAGKKQFRIEVILRNVIDLSDDGQTAELSEVMDVSGPVTAL